MVLAKSLEDWYKNWQKRRIENALAKGEAKGRAVGKAEGRAEERRMWVEWNERRDSALARGEDFTEPPPNGKA